MRLPLCAGNMHRKGVTMTKPSPILRIKQIFVSSAVIFTVAVLLLGFILAGASGNLSIDPIRFLLIFPFALSLAIGNDLHKAKKNSPFLSFLFHFIFTVGGFFLFLYLPAYKDASSSSSFLILLLFAAVYLVIYGIYAIFRSRWKKQVRLESDYQSQFSSEKGEG